MGSPNFYVFISRHDGVLTLFSIHCEHNVSIPYFRFSPNAPTSPAFPQPTGPREDAGSEGESHAEAAAEDSVP